MAGLQVQGLRELNRALRKLPGDLDIEIKTIHRVAAETVKRAALPNVPVRSGRLKGSVRALASKRSGRVAAGRKSVPYAGPIHFGWPARNIKAQPFLTDALEAERNKVVGDFERGLDRIIAKAFVKAHFS